MNKRTRLALTQKKKERYLHPLPLIRKDDWMEKTIPGFENRYTITDDCHIYNKNRHEIKQWIDKKTGYYFVRLRSNKHKDGFNYPVHRLLAICFIPNENNYRTVDHIDRNKLNNGLSNLRWASSKMQYQNEDNTQSRIKASERCKAGITTPLRKVNQYTQNGEYVATYSSLADAGRAMNTTAKQPSSLICMVCNGKKMSAYGYTWKYA